MMSCANDAPMLLTETAVEDDKILPRNPCGIRGAGTEAAPERLVPTVAQVARMGHDSERAAMIY
jgi:hypothetical protein